MASTLHKGMVLVAMPNLLDPNFRQTIVLLCEHGQEGSMGIVVNRPTTVPLTTVLPGEEALRGRPDRIFSGGPVQRNALMVLYQGLPSPRAISVLGDLHLSGDPELISDPERFLCSEERIRFYLGYAGWSPGQLQMELEAGGWNAVPGDSGIVFQSDPVRLWPRMMQDLGGEFSVYAQMPPDPGLN